jgi:hypothetical protein
MTSESEDDAALGEEGGELCTAAAADAYINSKSDSETKMADSGCFSAGK